MTDAIHGCILGGAIGDSAGIAFEGCNAGTELPVDLELTRLSDDTQLTLATCEAIAESGHVDPAEIAAAFLRWYREDRLFGIGASTYTALRSLHLGSHWAIAGRSGEYAAGNGAAMRIAPLAFCVGEDDMTTIGDVVRITHHNDEAFVGALAVYEAIRRRDRLSVDILTELAGELPDTGLRDRIVALAGRQGESTSELGAEFGASGYVVESVPLAIYAACTVHDIGFEAMLRQLIKAGGDTDTTCSIAGQIAGAAIGMGALPKRLVDRLPDRDLVTRVAGEFAARTAARQSTTTGRQQASC